jgi:PEP-CTERM motif
MKKLVLGLLAAMPMTVLATPITIDFSVTSNAAYAGYAAGTVGAGSFSFDDSIIDTTKTGWSDLAVGLTDPDISFNWLGTSFDSSNFRIWSLAWSPAGTIWDWGIGAVTADGCMNLNCVSWEGPTDFSMSSYAAVLHIEGYSGVAQASSVAWSIRPSTPVPEPGSLALICIGFASLAGASRARRRTQR